MRDDAESNGLATRIMRNSNEYEGGGDTEWGKSKVTFLCWDMIKCCALLLCISHNVCACVVARRQSSDPDLKLLEQVYQEHWMWTRGRGQVRSLSLSGQNSRMQSYRYHCLSGDRPFGGTTVGRTFGSGHQVADFNKIIFCSSVSACSLTYGSKA